MAKITIVRPYEWTNQRKNINVYIDDEKVGTVGIEKTVHFEVSPDKHKVVLKNKLSNGSQPLEVDLSDNEDKTITMSTFRYVWLIGIFLGISINYFYKFLVKLFNLQSTTSIVVFFFLIIGVVFLFFGLYLSKYAIRLHEVEEDAERVTV